MHDIRREATLTLKEAAKEAGVDVKTIQRWVKPTDDAGRLKRRFLESYLKGGRRMTSREALDRFYEVTQPAFIPSVSIGTAHTEAMAYLASVGIRT